MIRIFCLLFFLLTGFVDADDYDDLKYFSFDDFTSIELLAVIDDFDKPFQEPTIDKLVEWVPEQIPRTVSFYFDTDGDGVSDIIIAYYLIEAYACKEKCTIKLREFEDHWILVSSINNNPYSYYIIKKWSMWRKSEKEDWRSVEKTSANLYKYKKHEDWFDERFLKMWPNMAP
tara:strand:- start:63 stop:581 length:519 start_codon:yes stop_codon:yes gene_type:complete